MPAADSASLWYAVLIAVFALVVALGVLLHRRDARDNDEDPAAPPDAGLQPPTTGEPDVPQPRPRR